MKKLNETEATVLAMEIIATAMAGTQYLPTIKAVEYCLSKNLKISITDVSTGMVEIGENETKLLIVKIVIFGDVWSPTLKVSYSSISEEVEKLSNWLFDIDDVEVEDVEDNIDDYIKEEEKLI